MPLLTSIIAGGGDMQKYASKGLIQETKVIIWLHQFLRYDCGLEYADKLSAKDLKRLLSDLKSDII